MKIPVIILFIFCCFFACNTKPAKIGTVHVAPAKPADPYSMIREGQSLLKDGDLVTRFNRDPASQLIRNFNRSDKRFSHAGIVSFENGYPYVYHIVNGEENPGEKMRKDSLSWFCNPRKNNAFGIFRYEMHPDEAIKLKELIHKWFRKGIQFDRVFNLKTDDKMYCSEMISKLISKATSQRILIKTTNLTDNEIKYCSVYMHLPPGYVSAMKIVSIDNLYSNSFCHVVKTYSYK